MSVNWNLKVIVKLLRIRGVLERTGMYNTITQIFCDEYYFLEYLCRENYMKLAGPVDGPPPLDLVTSSNDYLMNINGCD